MITIKDIKEEDFIQYRSPSMTIFFPYCSFKCGKDLCHNYALRNTPNMKLSEVAIAYRYKLNKLTKAIVFSGLEPFDSLDDMVKLIEALRQYTTDPIVIYTGYTEDEIIGKLQLIIPYGNLIVKYGRYRPDLPSVWNEILGVKLASSNQYAKEYK